jgi:hypothetical protein
MPDAVFGPAIDVLDLKCDVCMLTENEHLRNLEMFHDILHISASIIQL